MNLIDQALKDKLKLFDEIDKELGTESSYKNTTNKISNNFPKNLKNLSTPQFDKIYSNFLLDQYQPKNIYNFKTTTKTNSNSNTINNNKKKNNNNNFNYNIKKTPTHSRSNSRTLQRSKSSNKNLNILIPPNDSGNRLYNYGFYIKNKLEKKRKEENDKIHKNMTPKILNKSKDILRDAYHFETRLYYNNDSNDNIYYKKRTLSKDNLNTFKPKLNKNSLKIANKLEPSSQRLIKNKKRKNNNNNEYYNKCKEIYNNIYNNNNNNFNYTNRSNSISPKNSKSKESIKHCNELYNKGIENMQKKEKNYKQKLMNKQEEYKKYSFKPNINKNSPLIDKNITKKNSSVDNNNLNNKKQDMYTKQCEWKKKLQNENKRKKEIFEKKNFKDCTFKPNISQLNIQNDEKFIMKNLQQMNDYVNKRRENIKKQKEYEQYKNKRLGQISNHSLKPTIPKEFEFQTKERSHSKNKNKFEDRKNNYTIFNYNYNNNNNNFDRINNNFNVNNNFGNYNNNINNNIYNNFDNVNYLNNNNFNNKDLNFSNNSLFGEQQFIEAVNALHNRIDNLNL